jgi:hypothetical protein
MGASNKFHAPLKSGGEVQDEPRGASFASPRDGATTRPLGTRMPAGPPWRGLSIRPYGHGVE